MIGNNIHIFGFTLFLPYLSVDFFSLNSLQCTAQCGPKVNFNPLPYSAVGDQRQSLPRKWVSNEGMVEGGDSDYVDLDVGDDGERR